MPKRNSETNYNTNLASEYLVMSLLNRIGKDAYLSLGNKKGVDIIVTTKTESYAIIEVKGVNKKTDDWLICSTGKFPSESNLFYALVSFESNIKDIKQSANVWLIPSLKLESDHKIAGDGKTVYLSHKNIRENYSEYLNNFDLLDEFIVNN